MKAAGEFSVKKLGYLWFVRSKNSNYHGKMGNLTEIQAVIFACLQLLQPDSKIGFVTKTALYILAKNLQTAARQNYNAKDQ